MNPHGRMPQAPAHFPVTADNFPIYVALAGAVVACLAYLITAFVSKGKARDLVSTRVARIAYYISSGAIGCALLYLLQCILSGARYDIAYVNENSSLRDAFLYRVSALWAGQGGSLLLWAAVGGFIGIFLLRKLEQSSPVLMAFWCSVQAFFVTLLIVDDPMKQLVNYQPGMMGMGMRAVLKNPWMVIHPPVVFIGYALLIVPAALAIQAVIDGDGSKWTRKCLPWAIGGWLAMTAGLVLGMIWSYEVLGWGGYWGWDPVENASLVPWLISTALVHGLVLQRHRERMTRWNVILAFAAFLAVIYATFLTRSGILSKISIHAFGDKHFRATLMFKCLKWVSIGYAAVCAGALVSGWKRIGSKDGKPLSGTSRELALGAGVVVLCLFAVMVLVGITYSTFHSHDPQHPVDLQPSFYTNMSVPLALAAIAFIALSPLLAWGSTKPGTGLNKAGLAMAGVLAVAVLAAVVSLIAPHAAHGMLDWIRPARRGLTDASGLLLLVGLALVALVTSILSVDGLTLRRSGAHVAHAGVALVIIGIVFSTTGKSTVVDIYQGRQPGEAFGYRFSYLGSHPTSDEREVLRVVGERNGHQFKAPMGVVPGEEGATMFPFIKSLPLSDLYLAPDQVMSNTLAPSLEWNGSSWVAHPVEIAGSKSALALVGMQVEAHSVVLQYMKPGSKPVEFTIAEGRTAVVDGYTFLFSGFPNVRDMMSSVTTKVKVTGRGLNELVVLRVSTKPLMSVLWLGTILIMVGGCLALVNRRSAKD